MLRTMIVTADWFLAHMKVELQKGFPIKIPYFATADLRRDVWMQVIRSFLLTPCRHKSAISELNRQRLGLT
jgi:hypothetical protein